MAASGASAEPGSGAVDLRALLLPLATEGVTVGASAGSVLVSGKAGEEITAAVRAALDNIRSHCVQNHVQGILGKFHLHNRLVLVHYAIEHGLTSPAGPQ